MKRSLLLIFLSIITLSVHSQHLKFMDIPIDGTISSFQSKLESKGIKVNGTKSKSAPNGQRIFEGKFQGYNSEITVFYNRKTKEVYKVETQIKSKIKTDIEIIFSQAINTVRDKYINEEKQDLHCNSGAYYIFHIKESRSDSVKLGTIYIEPTYSTYGLSSDVANCILLLTYEDYLNTSELLPSLTEPSFVSRNYLINHPEEFSEHMTWAEEYERNKDYEQSIYYYNRVLDYYRQGCPPEAIFDYEEYLNNKILTLQSYKIGRIITAYSEAYADVFAFYYDDGSFNCIRYDFFSHMYQVRLDRTEIAEQIKTLERLKSVYKAKKSSGIKHDNGKTEEIPSLTMHATIGESDIYGTKGEFYGWKKQELLMHYQYWEDELRVIVKYKDKSIDRHVIMFHDESDIDHYLNILKGIKL